MMRVLLALAVAFTWVNAAGWAQQRSHQPDSATVSDEEQVLRGLLESEARALSIDTPQDQSIRDLVDAVMKVRIKNLLELTDEETRDLYGIIGGALDKMHSLKWDRGALQFYLRQNIETQAAADDIAEMLDDAMDVEKNIALINKYMVEKAGEVLSPRQQAQLFLFTFDFEKEIYRLIQKAEEIASESSPTASKLIDPQSRRNNDGAGNDAPREKNDE